MARTTTRAADRRRRGYRTPYVDGSAARRLDVRRQLEEPRRQLSRRTRKNRERARYMNFAYVLFLSVALGLTAFILIGYIRQESAITTSVKTISRMESELNDMRQDNDEKLNRINSGIDMEEIRRIAITELGMTYAGEGQVVEIPAEGSDYVKQYQQVGK